MDYQTLLIKAMTYDSPPEIPMRCGILPAVWKERPGEMRDIVAEFPKFFGTWFQNYNYQERLSNNYRCGTRTDEWGCVWSNIEEGMEGYVTGHPVPDRRQINTLEIPPNRNGSLPHGFMWLRLLDLRGFDEAMMDYGLRGGAAGVANPH